MRLTNLVPLVLLVPSGVWADEIHLRGGGQISGVVVARTPESVTVEVGPGRITFPAHRVLRIETSDSALASYREWARSLAPDDLEGWLELGEWARRAGLGTQAREAFEQARAIAPAEGRAQRGLGNVLQGGQWMQQEDAYRAQGLVLFEGRWVSREERAEAQRSLDRETETRLRARVAEAEARALEAAARSADAQARAAEAEAEADRQGQDVSIPWPYVYGGLPAHCRDRAEPCDHDVRPRRRGGRHREPHSEDTSRPPRSSLGGASKREPSTENSEKRREVSPPPRRN